ncbi:MAG: hypothetical protein Q7U76_12890 [Nitrospirota bacterium]|nr:hypothetical protein [Nitrospirota bacterium]
MKSVLRNLFAVAMVLLAFAGLAEAQTAPTYIGANCQLAWLPNSEPDLAGYRAFAVQSSTTLPMVTIPKTATSHPTSTTCAALGIVADGAYRLNVLAYDLAGNASNPAYIDGVKDTLAPISPRQLQLTTSAQPVAMSVTPNPSVQQATIAWVPGTCQGEFIVSRLVSSRWVEIGRTYDHWLDVPLVNAVNQPYGVSAVCEG